MLDQESPTTKKPEEVFEFPKIGKKLPYTVPEDFFEKIPGKTLLIAKKRVNRQHVRMMLTKSLLVFTAAAAILIFIFLVPPHELKQSNRLAFVAKSHEMEPERSVQQKTKIKMEQSIPSEVTAQVSTQEGIEDVLQDLSDEELSQVFAQYKSEELEDVLSQETININ